MLFSVTWLSGLRCILFGPLPLLPDCSDLPLTADETIASLCGSLVGSSEVLSCTLELQEKSMVSAVRPPFVHKHKQ
jgi:hypothetical protein